MNPKSKHIRSFGKMRASGEHKILSKSKPKVRKTLNVSRKFFSLEESCKQMCSLQESFEELLSLRNSCKETFLLERILQGNFSPWKILARSLAGNALSCKTLVEYIPWLTINAFLARILQDFLVHSKDALYLAIRGFSKITMNSRRF